MDILDVYIEYRLFEMSNNLKLKDVEKELKENKIKEQNLRLNCLNIASKVAPNSGYDSPKRVLDAAKMFYDFVETGSSSSNNRGIYDGQEEDND